MLNNCDKLANMKSQSKILVRFVKWLILERRDRIFNLAIIYYYDLSSLSFVRKSLPECRVWLFPTNIVWQVLFEPDLG